jgi:hypothetical protein
MEINNSDAIRVVTEQSADSAAYFRQWILWLGLGSAGAAATFMSLAANACDPNYSFHHLILSFWLFLLGIVSAASSLLLASLRSNASVSHHAAAHNRDQARAAASKLPLIISSPQRIADEMNHTRNQLEERAKKEDAIAELAWRMRSIWNAIVIVLLAISAMSFVVGVALPLVSVSLGENVLGNCIRSERGI